MSLVAYTDAELRKGENLLRKLVDDAFQARRLTAYEAAHALVLVANLRAAILRRRFWLGFLDGITLGPVWRRLKRRRS